MFDTLKQRALRQAAKLAESSAGQRLLSRPEVQRAVQWAIDTSTRVRANLSEARKSLRQLSAGGEDDLEPLKRKLDPHVDS
jgi:hypothetical protein